MNPTRLDSEPQVARRVMEGLLPRTTPALKGFDIAAFQSSFEVAGDYYAFIPLGDDRYGLAIVGVVGKGIAAALFVAAVRASLASLAGLELTVRAIFRRGNRLYLELVDEGRCLTLFYAVMDVPSRRLVKAVSRS